MLMNTLIERIQALMDAQGWDVEKVAEVAGVSSSAVYQWLGHGTKTIHSIGKIEAAIKLERASGFSALWLAKGVGPKMVSGEKVSSEVDHYQPHSSHGDRLIPDNLLIVSAEENCRYLCALGEALEHATPADRAGAIALLTAFISDPRANADLVPLIAKRLAGEPQDGKPSPQQERKS